VNTLSYKGYQGSIEVDAEDQLLFGKILFVNDLVSYEGDSVKELTTAFQEAVDDYLAMCSQAGKSPDKPLSGAFNVRIGPDLHRLAALKAASEGTTLNNLMVRALADYLNKSHIQKHEHRHEIVVFNSVTADSSKTQVFSLSSTDEQSSSLTKH